MLGLAGWLTGDLDLFSPDGAADLETDLYVAAVLVASYGVISLASKLFDPEDLADVTRADLRGDRRRCDGEAEPPGRRPRARRGLAEPSHLCRVDSDRRALVRHGHASGAVSRGTIRVRVG